MKSAYVVSDLHMFCRRSRWETYLNVIQTVAESADLFVFNGDTVDFKWTTLENVSETVSKAIDFLEAFALRYPNCHVHVNLGNHDHHHEFITALDKLAYRMPNFSWHPYYLRVGRSLFLHGDVANRKMTHNDLADYRSGWLYHEKQGQLKNRVYDVAFRARAHIVISQLAFPRRLTLRRVAAYLEDIGQDSSNGVKNVYFGHTHIPIKGRGYRGVTFYNGGAPFEGLSFQLLKAEI